MNRPQITQKYLAPEEIDLLIDNLLDRFNLVATRINYICQLIMSCPNQDITNFEDDCLFVELSLELGNLAWDLNQYIEQSVKDIIINTTQIRKTYQDLEIHLDNILLMLPNYCHVMPNEISQESIDRLIIENNPDNTYVQISIEDTGSPLLTHC